MRHYTICLLCACCFVLSFNTAQAQDLSLNITIENTLASNASTAYAFTAREGQLLSFVARADDTLDTILRIENLTGDTILSADDYDYPNSRDAVIEGFVAPYSGSYTLVVEGFSDSSGDYTLTMLSGYSTLATQDTFENNSSWEAISTDLIEAPELNIVNGTANLIQSGIDQVGLALGVTPDSDIYFIRTTIDSIRDNAGWRTGLVFGYQDEQNYSRVVINYRGAWRLLSVQNGEEVVLRDWNIHPAITPAITTFTLSVLVNGSHFDIFYDDQFIGNGNDPNFRHGQVGFVAETIEAIGSELTVRFDDLTITTPTLVDDIPIFPDNIIANGTNSSIRELEQRLLIPTGGEMAFTLSESFAQNNREGVSRFPIGDGRTATNFALGARVTWVSSSADLNGCGFTVRDNDADDYVLVYLDSAGGYGISERSGSEFIQNSFKLRIDNIRPPYELVLIIRDDLIHYFINGSHAMSLNIGTREGSIAEAVINFESVNTNCQFNNLWLWQW